MFTEPTYPINRDKPIEHEIRLIDENKEPPKKRLYPLDTDELKELKEQI